MDFLQKIEDSLKNCNLSCAKVFSPRKTIGFGVSGGADSMALLYSFILLRKKYFGDDGAIFFVVSVNHNIRPTEEGVADTIFVKNFCDRFKDVNCIIVELKEGQVENLAKQRNRGIEEAARNLRYEIFYQEAKNNYCEHFFLAHNQNDQLETLLFRFLQGSGGATSQGILPVRDIFIRPFLQITRKEIEAFLVENKISWVIDKTNFENDYLRNKCRNLLMPILDKEFPGWGKAILTGSEKACIDNDFITSQLPVDFWKKDNKSNLVASWDSFLNLHAAIRRRILYEGLNLMGLDSRIPFHLIQRLSTVTSKYTRGRIFSCGHLEVRGEIDNLMIKFLVQDEIKDFSIIIDSPGVYFIHDNGIKFEVKQVYQSSELCLCGLSFTPPFILRRPKPGDKYLMNNKKEAVISNTPRSNEELICIVEEYGKDYVTLIKLS